MEAFTGEVRMMGFRFAPQGWASCDGQPMPAAQHDGLFKQIGYRFGGSGGTFNLPDLRDGQIALGTGAAPGLTPRAMGDTGGVTTVTLTEATMPPHTHLMLTASEPGDVSTPTASTALARSNGAAAYGPVDKLKEMDARVVGGVRGGDGKPHENRMPFQAVYYCICLQGWRSGT